MKASLFRWLLHRDKPDMKPLAMRTSWFDFAGRMHRAIALDMAVLLGEVSLAELRVRHITRPLSAYSAETIAEPRRTWWYDADTLTDDPGQTRTMDVACVNGDY